MASLRETKDRIASIRSTLKITSAMKLVSSSKLRKSQKAIEGMRPYSEAMCDVLAVFRDHPTVLSITNNGKKDAPVAIVAMASNNSLCGGFNTQVVRFCTDFAASFPSVVFFPVGRKMAEALKKMVLSSNASATKNESAEHTCAIDTDWETDILVAKPDYHRSAHFASQLIHRYEAGEFSAIYIVHNRFFSAAKQAPIVDRFLPFVADDFDYDKSNSESDEYIFEQDPAQIARSLVPQLLCLRMHTSILDSSAAEHAARTLAMQTATDNAEKLLGDLTLEYNKARQQKITSEILDLVGGTL